MQQRVEDDLVQRTREHLDRNNLQWASVAFKGRDATLLGRAEEESDQRRPSTEIAKIWGVRTLEDRIEVLQLVKNYVWNATTNDGALALTGYVPNEAARKAILASARSAFPKHKIDDKLELARGAPDQKQWLGGTAFALRQLAALKPGGRAGLEATGLVIQGEADSSKGYETVRSQLGRSLPQGISLKTERVIPPVVKPYTWAAALRGRQIELTGHAPSVAARDEIKSAAERALSGASVVDRMTIASGAPGDWQKVATSALTRLGQLRQGNAELRDSQLTVTGLTETEEGAEAVRRSLKADVPSSFRLVEQIRQDPAVRAAEEARRAAEDARRAAEARRAADEASRAEAAKRSAEEIARAEAAKRAADEAAHADATKRSAEAKRAADEAARADANKRAADAARAEAARRAATEAEARAAKAKADAEAAVVARAGEAQRCQSSLASAVATGNIVFQRASAELDRRSHQTLESLAQIVKGCPGFAIEVGGHTDNEGEPDRNQRLSERRAKSVLDYLVRSGVSASALTSVGYGQAQPKVPNDSPANMAVNRRIEFSVKAK